LFYTSQEIDWENHLRSNPCCV